MIINFSFKFKFKTRSMHIDYVNGNESIAIILMTIQFLFRTNRHKWYLIARLHISAFSKIKRNQQPRRKLLISFLFSIKWRDLHNEFPVLNNNSGENRSVLFNNDVKMNFFSTNYSSHANDLNIRYKETSVHWYGWL